MEKEIQGEERKKVRQGDGKARGERGVFMSGCRRHSGAPPKRKPSLIQSAGAAV